MAAIDFPFAPVHDDEYSVNGKTWVYDSSIPAWKPKPTPEATQAEMEAGTEADARVMSPLLVGQAVAALAPSPDQASITAAITNKATFAADNDIATAAQGTLAGTALQKASLLTGAGTITPKSSGDLDMNNLGGTVDNAAVNAAIEEDQVASRASMEVNKSGQQGVASIAAKMNAEDQSTRSQIRSLLFGDSIALIPEVGLRAAFGYGGEIATIVNGDGAQGGTYTAVYTSCTVVAATDVFTSTAHAFQTGDPIKFAGSVLPSAPELSLGIMNGGSTYYAIRIDADTFKIATSYATALAGTPIDITSTGTSVTVATASVSSIGITPLYAKAFTGSCVKLRTGSVVFHAYGASNAVLGTVMHLWYWSETNGGTFKVQSDSDISGTYSDMVPDNAGTAPGTTGASATVDSTEGGSGVLRYLTYTITNPTFKRIKVVGLTGNSTIIAGGTTEAAAVSGRIPGIVNIDCSNSGSDPTQWDDISDTDLAILLNAWNPQIIFVRGKESLSQWSTEFAAFAARIKAIKPSAQIVVIGMHVTGDNNVTALDDIDQWQETWCGDNNATFVPIRNRMGDLTWCVDNYLTARDGSTFTATGTHADDTLTAASHNLSVDQWIRFEALAGGTGLITGLGYQVASVPTANTFTLKRRGVSALFTSDISASTISRIDGTHQSAPGQEFVKSLVMEALNPMLTARYNLDSRAVDGRWSLLGSKLTPAMVQNYQQDRAWTYGGPNNKKIALRLARVDGANTPTGYITELELSSTSSIQSIRGSGGIGWGMTWDTNYAVIGSTTSRWLGSSVGGIADSTEIYTGNSGLSSLAVSSAATTTAHKPLQVWRAGASSASKGTEVARLDPTGQLKIVIRTFADDAAADADATLLSGMLYRTTAGVRTVFQKP